MKWQTMKYCIWKMSCLCHYGYFAQAFSYEKLAVENVITFENGFKVNGIIPYDFWSHKHTHQKKEPQQKHLNKTEITTNKSSY